MEILNFKIRVIKEELRHMSQGEISKESLLFNAYAFGKAIRKDPDVNELRRVIKRSRLMLRDRAMGLFKEMIEEMSSKRMVEKLEAKGMSLLGIAGMKIKIDEDGVKMDWEKMLREDAEVAREAIGPDFAKEEYYISHAEVFSEVNRFANSLVFERAYRVLWSIDMDSQIGTFEEFKAKFSAQDATEELFALKNFNRLSHEDQESVSIIMQEAYEQVQMELISRYEQLLHPGRSFEN